MLAVLFLFGTIIVAAVSAQSSASGLWHCKDGRGCGWCWGIACPTDVTLFHSMQECTDSSECSHTQRVQYFCKAGYDCWWCRGYGCPADAPKYESLEACRAATGCTAGENSVVASSGSNGTKLWNCHSGQGCGWCMGIACPSGFTMFNSERECRESAECKVAAANKWYCVPGNGCHQVCYGSACPSSGVTFFLEQASCEAALDVNCSPKGRR